MAATLTSTQQLKKTFAEVSVKVLSEERVRKEQTDSLRKLSIGLRVLPSIFKCSMFRKRDVFACQVKLDGKKM